MYYLKHKNNVVAVIELTNNATHVNIKEVIKPEMLPLCAQVNQNNINNWWKRRAIPTSRTNIKQLLSDNGFASPHQFLLQNLALSVTDCYWVCDEKVDIAWESVSFHKNDFHEDIHFCGMKESSSLFVNSTLNPSASLGGDLDKRWVRKKGQIFLVKGNMPGNSYQQSLNEVFASLVHKNQGFRNYVTYKLIKLASGSIGCISPCFTTEDLEFVPAWEIFDKYGTNKTQSYLQQYIDNCAKEGLRKEDYKKFLDYLFMIDFILSNTDRHLANFGLLRDSNTLQCVSPAPIFDSGNSMFYDGISIMNYHTLLNIKTNSLYSTERKIIDNLINYDTVDLSKLPSFNQVKLFYEKDPTLISFASKIASCFEFKKAMVNELQCGKCFSDISNDIIAFYSGKDREEKENLQTYCNTVLQPLARRKR